MSETHTTDLVAAWRENIGQRLMLQMTCNHGTDYFGSGAVCKTCWTNTQRIGRLIEHEIAKAKAEAWREGAQRGLTAADYEGLADDQVDLLPNPYLRDGLERTQ